MTLNYFQLDFLSHTISLWKHVCISFTIMSKERCVMVEVPVLDYHQLDQWSEFAYQISALFWIHSSQQTIQHVLKDKLWDRNRIEVVTRRVYFLESLTLWDWMFLAFVQIIRRTKDSDKFQGHTKLQHGPKEPNYGPLILSCHYEHRCWLQDNCTIWICLHFPRFSWVKSFKDIIVFICDMLKCSITGAQVENESFSTCDISELVKSVNSLMSVTQDLSKVCYS